MASLNILISQTLRSRSALYTDLCWTNVDSASGTCRDIIQSIAVFCNPPPNDSGFNHMVKFNPWLFRQQKGGGWFSGSVPAD